MVADASNTTTAQSGIPRLDDATLVARFKSGDESAFPQIVSAHRDRIFRYVKRWLKDATDAEEVTQDTFVKAHRGLTDFRGDSSLRTWLHTIARNLAHSRHWYFFRRRRHDTFSLDTPLPETEDLTALDTIQSTEPDPSEYSARAEFTQTVKHCLEEIDPIFRRPLELRVGKGLRYGAISKISGVPVGTVKSRIARARRDLKARLTEEIPELKNSCSFRTYFTAIPR